MIVLGLDTSCDDTSAAVVKDNIILSNIVSSQLIHNKFGGVVPELASRAHIKLSLPVIQQALAEADISKEQLNGIAVTYGPGLIGSLLTGLCIAKGLSLSLEIPFIGINHLEGHVFSNLLADPEFSLPFVVLIVSGGHTQLVLVNKWGDYEVLGKTRDDAAGEAFDKVAKMLGLGYPGGPVIEKTAKKGDPDYIHFPRAFLKNDSFDFSFSGLKTAVMNHVFNIGKDKLQDHIKDIAVCFQEAVVEVLVKKTVQAAQENKVNHICLAGGVAVNSRLRMKFEQESKSSNLEVLFPSAQLCTDNGAMIAAAGIYYLKQGSRSLHSLSPEPSLNF
ncbi:MAG: tRNA (adenosine(37)-N6)-threonylcarbamoyltransferase complex transferase subunit TsaD [bacterium]